MAATVRRGDVGIELLSRSLQRLSWMRVSWLIPGRIKNIKKEDMPTDTVHYHRTGSKQMGEVFNAD